MKRVAIASLLSALTLFLHVGCDKTDNDELVKPEGRVITNIRQLGAPVANPTNSSLCLDAGSAENTLSSLRRISDRFYYMDFTTDLQFDKLIKGGYKEYDAYNAAMDNLWFTEDGKEQPFDEEHPQHSCSGFVCFNEKGEVLFGRNLDGAGGPLCLLFNSTNGYKYIQFTAPHYNSMTYNGISKGDPEESGDGILSDGKTSLHRLLRQPMATMDGINEYGLCFGAFQLPVFASEEMPIGPTRVMQDEAGKDYVANSLMQNLFLSKCKTVKEVETMMRSYNFLALHPSINVHWLVADATGDYAVFEYWNDKLYVMRPDERMEILWLTSQVVPYEYNSIENYYANPEATKNYLTDTWQYSYSTKQRARHLMDAYADKVRVEFIDNQYKPVMSEMEALECLQAGSFAIEVPGDVTNWSCVYNPAQKTILFNMRNDMSQIYKIDFDKDFQDPGSRIQGHGDRFR